MEPFESPQYRLPDFEYYDEEYYQSVIYGYGSAYEAAKYCGFDEPPYTPIGEWQHGWAPAEHNYHPAAVICGNESVDDNQFFWVGRKDQEDFLKQSGINNVKAIGCNMLYTRDPAVERIPNSLLIMPIRSLYMSEYDWNCDDYINDIIKIKDDFDVIAACIHPACLQRGDWVNEFKDLGITVICGAKFQTQNSLLRLKWLFSRFEFVTSNGMGSNMGFAAYCGAKFSFYGSYFDIKKEHWANVGLFVDYPEILEKKVELISYNSVSKKYPEFFHEHPRDAKEQIDWAADQLGIDNKLTPKEMADAFLWPDPTIKIRKLSDSEELKSTSAKTTKRPNELPPINKKTLTVYSLIRNSLKGCNYSQLILAQFFLEGLYAKQNNEYAAAYAYMAASNGLPEAQHLIGYLYLSGTGVDKDESEAYHWFELASNGGHIDSIFRCGWMLFNGSGCQKDINRGQELISNAAELGNPDAKTYLGKITVS